MGGGLCWLNFLGFKVVIFTDRLVKIPTRILLVVNFHEVSGNALVRFNPRENVFAQAVSESKSVPFFLYPLKPYLTISI